MARSTTHRLSPSLSSLGRSLSASERAALRRFLVSALAWQRELRRFPALVRHAPDATPYVSIYENGALRGCYGSHEGSPNERLARAFLRALMDTRYGGIAETQRERLVLEVAYVTSAHPVRMDEVARVMEPGRHGLALTVGDTTTVLLPSVARDRGYDAEGMLDLLARKAEKTRGDEGLVWLLGVDTVADRWIHARDPKRAALRWMESLVSKNGIAFEIDAQTGLPRSDGPMRHGRLAVTVAALAGLGASCTRDARRWLAREIELGLRSPEKVVGWPADPDAVLGTLALARMAGIEVPLETLANRATMQSPWHAAQVAAALGASTPTRLWQFAVASLTARPFAPYLTLAARQRNDGAIVERCVRALAMAFRDEEPFVGGANVTKMPETALTAVAVEALVGLGSREAESAIARGRKFIAARQILDVPAAMTPAGLGAFRASPIAPLLRCDITAHAALALWS